MGDSEFTFTEKFLDDYGEWTYIWHNEDKSYYLVFYADKEYETGEPVTFNHLYVMEEQYVPYEEFKNGNLGGGPTASNSIDFSTDSNNILSFSDIDGYGGTLQFVDN